MLLDPARPARWDDELDELVSTALDDSEVETRLAAINDEVQAIHRCVETPNPFTFTLDRPIVDAAAEPHQRSATRSCAWSSTPRRRS
jgi:hypothetical protein